jgi:hypothetical protein
MGAILKSGHGQMRRLLAAGFNIKNDNQNAMFAVSKPSKPFDTVSKWPTFHLGIIARVAPHFLITLPGPMKSIEAAYPAE